MKRILHVLGAMNQGGVETWLMHMLRTIDRTRFELEFAVHTGRPAFYDSEIRSLGSRLHICAEPHRPLQYGAGFLRLLKEQGPYDVVHSHVHHYSGVVLKLASHAGVPNRIAHSHNDKSTVEADAGFARKAYLRLMKHWVSRYATKGFAASEPAARDLFGREWKKNKKWSLLYCAIDLAPFELPASRSAVRRELAIPEAAFVIGHVGRFDPQKNHAYLVEVLAELAKIEPDVMGLLIGRGSLREDVQKKAKRLGLAEKIRFAEDRTDIARLMTGAMDLFLFPSLYEGLPLALLEAQAAGLPCVISNAIAEDAEVVGSLIRRIDLKDGAGKWAREIARIRKTLPLLSRADALRKMRRSSFDISSSIRAIERNYEI